jgi:hypothetical protein
VASFNSHVYPDHLYVMDTDGSDLRRLNEVGGHFAWSPDGSLLANQRSNRVEPGSTDYCPDEWYIDYCASAEWITLIDVETGAERDLLATRFPNPGIADPKNDGPAIGDWSWSPDGLYILMMQGDTPTRPLVIDVATDTSSELPWTTDSVPSWQRVAAG